ncbi:MAG: ion transporter, partial [Terricaulis sp.]
MPLIKRKHSTIKAYIHDWLEPDDGKINFFSGVIIALVLVSLTSLALETEALQPDTNMDANALPILRAINVTVVWLFALEFALRFWSEGENPLHKGIGGRIKFLTEPITIADLLAFLPELIALQFFPDATGAWFPALRALRLFRLFKLARYVPAFAIVGAAVKRAWPPLVASLCVAGSQLYIAAMVLYFIEGDTKPEAFGSITRAMWW